MKKTFVALLFVIAFLVYFFYPEKVITYPPGELAPKVPVQNNLTKPKFWNLDDFTIEALAEYKIKARVLSRNNFYFGKESELSPLDLVLQ